MNINQFKEGDIITRVERSGHDYGNGRGDGSYCGERLTFVGVEKGIIFFVHDFCGEPTVHTLSGKEWMEGWDYYPETLAQRAKQIAVGISKTLQAKKE